jgi:protein involved in polysaccharide export with SLBB domain
MKKSIYFLALIAALFVMPVLTYAQTKTEVDTSLQKMSSEEIDRRIREAGLTREEAIQRANAMGINLEEYLSKSQSAGTGTGTGTESGKQGSNTPSVAPQFSKSPSRSGILIPQRMKIVRGFANRQFVDSLLQPFGYSIFQYPATTFEPTANVPTPPSYVVGPGDEISVSVWGDTRLNYQLTVNREGNLPIPDVGPVSVNGLTIQGIKEKLLHRMTDVYSSIKHGSNGATSFLDISLGKIRTIQVFVLGEVVKPGGYNLSSLSTMMQALYISGGPTNDGSLRNIELLRNNKKNSTLDFYDYAIRADKSNDIRLQDGDIVFVRPAGNRVAMTGNVLRPAIYEFKGTEHLGDLLSLAGGLQFSSYIKRIHIERVIPFDQRKEHEKDVLDIDLQFNSIAELIKSPYTLEDGDIVHVFSIKESPECRVKIAGNIKNPGAFELVSGMRIRDLVLKADSLDRDAFLEKATLMRLLPNLRRDIITINLKKAIDGAESDNLELENEDSLTVYKESDFYPEHTVSIEGAVRKPGNYTRNEKMSVMDLIVLAGGLREGAAVRNWELARIDTSSNGRLSKVFEFTPGSNMLENQELKDFQLKDFDHLNVPFSPKFNFQKVVTVNGYVMSPGNYVIQYEGERVASIIKRAYGLRPGAYLEGATLIRAWKNLGLVPIDFEVALKDTESLQNTMVLDGDSINIPFREEVIAVRGSVFTPASVVYEQGQSLRYYIHQAGGFTDSADVGRVVVTLPNGRKWEPRCFFLPDPDILGGSTVFVPTKVEREDKTLPVLRDWATIFLSIATMAVAIVQITK